MVDKNKAGFLSEYINLEDLGIEATLTGSKGYVIVDGGRIKNAGYPVALDEGHAHYLSIGNNAGRKVKILGIGLDNVGVAECTTRGVWFVAEINTSFGAVAIIPSSNLTFTDKNKEKIAEVINRKVDIFTEEIFKLPVFVYGNLRKSYEYHRYLEKFSYYKSCKAIANNFDIYGLTYALMVPNNDTKSKVKGELYWFNREDMPAVIEKMDTFEKCYNNNTGSLFLREVIEVDTDEVTVKALAYIYNEKMVGNPHNVCLDGLEWFIQDGDFKNAELNKNYRKACEYLQKLEVNLRELKKDIGDVKEIDSVVSSTINSLNSWRCSRL